jgi:hypothetical protein
MQVVLNQPFGLKNAKVKKCSIFFKKLLTVPWQSGIFMPHTVTQYTKHKIKMRTKALLIAAAALAAGVITSQAQVYSQNIVGYVNQPLGGGWNGVANPLDNSTGNSLTNIIQNPVGNFDGTFVYTWNGTSFTVVQYDSSQPTGIANSSDTAAVPSPIINPGEGFFFNNQYQSVTNTFVGQVHIDSGTYPGTSTNIISDSQTYSFVSSVLPIGGGLSSVLGLTNSAGALDGTFIYLPNISATGAFLGYNVVQFDSSQTTGFANSADTSAVPEPVIPVGASFLINNQSGAAITWVQSIGQ